MRIGCKTGGPGDGVSYRGSHGQTVRVGRSDNACTALVANPYGNIQKCSYLLEHCGGNLSGYVTITLCY